MIEDRVRQYVQQGLGLSTAALNAAVAACCGRSCVDDAAPHHGDRRHRHLQPAGDHGDRDLQPRISAAAADAAADQQASWGQHPCLRATSQMRNEQHWRRLRELRDSMNRNTRTLIVMAVAVLMAGLASFGVYLAVRSMPVREVEVARAQAVVAARPLMLGMMLTKDDVKVVPWPAANQVPGCVHRDRARRQSGRRRCRLSENEPLTEAKLAAVGAGRGPAADASPKACAPCRFASTRWSASPGSSSPAPGWTCSCTSRSQEGQPSTQTRVVLSNVQVLTAGTRYDQERRHRARASRSRPSVVTLLLTPEDAEKLTLASVEGQHHADASQSARCGAHGRPRAPGSQRAARGGEPAAGEEGRRRAYRCPRRSQAAGRRRRRRSTRSRPFARPSALKRRSVEYLRRYSLFGSVWWSL